jgi:acyl-CoA thioester hydrolase
MRSDFNFSWPFRIRYAEVDGQMVVFNAHYLTFFDTAINEYLRALPFNYMGHVEATGEDFHTVRTLVEYQQPIRFDDEIRVHVRVARMGRSSLTFRFEIHPDSGEDLRATGEVVWVNTCQKSHKSVPLPKELVEKLAAHEGPGLER